MAIQLSPLKVNSPAATSKQDMQNACSGHLVDHGDGRMADDAQPRPPRNSGSRSTFAFTANATVCESTTSYFRGVADGGIFYS